MRTLGILAGLVLTTVAFGATAYFGLLSAPEFQPGLSRTQLSVIARALQLSSEEQKVVEDLHEAHAASILEASADIRTSMEDAAERAEMLGDGSLAERLWNESEQWRERKLEMDKAFLQELRLVLNAEQEARWALVERELRRIESMPRGRMVGEGLDVITLLEDLRIEPNDAMMEALERYARDLDPALQARDDLLSQHEESDLDAMLDSDLDIAKNLFERSRALRMAVRDANLRALEQVCAAAPKETGDRIRAEARHRWAARLELTRSRAADTLTAVRSVSTLTTTQKTRIERLAMEYTIARDTWDARYIKAVMEVEAQALPKPLESRLKMREEASKENFDGFSFRSERMAFDSLKTLWEERIGLDRTFRADLRNVLSEPEQMRLLPNLGMVGISAGELFGTWDYFSL